MKRGVQGTLTLTRTGPESFRAFVPRPLPPNPPISVDTEMQDLVERANRALGRLDGITMLIPDIWLFLYYYVRKEAVLSSQIEGTQSTLSDLLLFESKEIPGVPLNDVQEVSNYVAAMNHGLKRIKEGFPLSVRLLREVHEKLLAKGRGSGKGPGAFRASQNWVGGSRPGNAEFVPPPASEVVAAMGALELFLHNKPSRTRWLEFFLQGVIETSEQAVETARRILALFEDDRKKIEKLGSSGGSAFRVHHLLQKKVYTSITSAVEELKLTYPTVSRSMDELVKLGIVQEVTGQRRGRIFAYGAYLRLLSEGTEPLGDQEQGVDMAAGQTLSEPQPTDAGSISHS